MTPAERAARVLDPDTFALQSPANRALLIPPVIARAQTILAAALPTRAQVGRALCEALEGQPCPDLDECGYFNSKAADAIMTLLGEEA